MDCQTLYQMKPQHKKFFSSLKQVEKRLKLEDGDPPAPPPPSRTTEIQPSESSTSSPLYFHSNTSSSSLDSTSQPPQEFLSFNDFQSNPPQPHETGAAGDIDLMQKVLRLNDFDGKGPEMPEIVDDEFYDKIVKVKGPGCKKEVERLDGWIKYFVNHNNGGKVLEPLRLAHLVLAKAAFVSAGGDGDADAVWDGLEFPVNEFLQNDPPSD